MLCRRLALAVAFVLMTTPLTSRAEDWPQWRGPRGDGTSNETNVPTKWSDTENVH
jgi:hypothetical protein